VVPILKVALENLYSFGAMKREISKVAQPQTGSFLEASTSCLFDRASSSSLSSSFSSYFSVFSTLPFGNNSSGT
jgi:hypothetical protein